MSKTTIGILDNFKISGTDEFALSKLVKAIPRQTKVITVPGSSLTWWCMTTDGSATEVIKACPADTMRSGSGKFTPLNNLRKAGWPAATWSAELWDEALSQNRVFVTYVDDMGAEHFMTVSSRVLSDFALLGITGSAAQEPSYHLLGLVAEKTSDKQITLVIRVEPHKNGDIEKVISMRSDSYAYIPQDEALALATQVSSDGDIAYWNVDNFLTEVVYEFPQHTVNTVYGRKKGAFAPYIRYTTSDAGDSSCSFSLGWRINNDSTVFLASGAHRVFRTHKGEWTKELAHKLLQSAVGLKDKFTILPQRLSELDTIVVPADKVDVAVRHLCSDAKITAKATSNALVEYVTGEFSGTDATGAEIVLAMIEAPAHSEALKDLSNNSLLQLQHKLGEVPYQRIRFKI